MDPTKRGFFSIFESFRFLSLHVPSVFSHYLHYLHVIIHNTLHLYREHSLSFKINPNRSSSTLLLHLIAVFPSIDWLSSEDESRASSKPVPALSSNINRKLSWISVPFSQVFSSSTLLPSTFYKCHCLRMKMYMKIVFYFLWRENRVIFRIIRHSCHQTKVL